MPTDNASIESLSGQFRAAPLKLIASSVSTKRVGNARLGVVHLHSEIGMKFLRCFIGRSLIPATGPPE